MHIYIYVHINEYIYFHIYIHICIYPIEKNDLDYLKNNIESIKFYKSKNVKNYLIMDLCDYSEIVFVKKN